MRGESNKYQYLRSAKKGREGLCHQRTKTQAGHRALSEFAKKETLRIVPQQFLTIKRDTVQLTYPNKSVRLYMAAHFCLKFPCFQDFFNTIYSFFSFVERFQALPSVFRPNS